MRVPIQQLLEVSPGVFVFAAGGGVGGVFWGPLTERWVVRARCGDRFFETFVEAAGFAFALQTREARHGWKQE